MDNKIVDMMNDRFDRIENKVDSLVEFKSIWMGKITVLSIVGAAIGSIGLSFLVKKFIG